MFNVVNSSNGITVERNEKGIFKISGNFKVPFKELPREEQKDILKRIKTMSDSELRDKINRLQTSESKKEVKLWKYL